MGLRALLVGINAYPDRALEGCVNDALGMKEALGRRYGAAGADLRVLLDKHATGAAILEGIRWLAEPDAGGGGARLFHYAGHGTQRADQSNGDEADGFDECLVPCDYPRHGVLVDDQLAQEYAKFDPAMHVVLVMDCCHAGTSQKGGAAAKRHRRIETFAEWRRGKRVLAERVLDRVRRAVPRPISDDEAAAVTAMALAMSKNLGLRARDAGALASRNLAPAAPLQADIADALKGALGVEQNRYGLDTGDGRTVLLAASRARELSAEIEVDGQPHGVLTYFLLKALETANSYGELHDRLMESLKPWGQEPQLECGEALRSAPFLNGVRGSQGG